MVRPSRKTRDYKRSGDECGIRGEGNGLIFKGVITAGMTL